MNKVEASFDGIEDPTCYLFSFAKSLSAVLKNSPFKDYSEDIIATSGFAFRMWAAEDLCPSATSIWTFHDQKTWVENGGLLCDYVERLWDQDSIENERREQAIALIKKSIDNGIAVVSWDVSNAEWGIINGYNDSEKILSIVKVNREVTSLPFEKLGKIEIPILSVLSIIGKTDKSREEINKGMMRIASSHLRGEEWSSKNKKGLEVYPFLIDYINKKISSDVSWNLEYYIGTYASLKLYALKYFNKYKMSQFSEKYNIIFNEWLNAFNALKSGDVTSNEIKSKIVKHLENAYKEEKKALELMEKYC
ncbi:hypothetical protein M9Y10_028710 [Tritrichomonas musculus]|uniref:Uncharacterized protein n=1 Tax=Tritrichomonas musculus TaxID=1915356 RepID=A0ABR2KNG0_9EUKA